MTRTEYLAALEAELRPLPKADFQEAMDYFTEYFDEAGLENEDNVIAELGTPKEAAADILQNVLGQPNQEHSKIRRSKKDIALIVALGILASPLLFVITAIITGILLSILTIIVTFIIFVAAMLATGFILSLACIILAFVTLAETVTIFSSAWQAIFLGLGGFFGFIGAGVLLFTLCLFLSRLFGKGLTASVKWLNSNIRRKWGKRHGN